ncbi:MAG: transglycosylase domain-containing protein, partial [Bdellovibrionaceae bacterium]|nr:transglycosylase domain-containing protein [Pseudobdellovibrionaceae bacterium]
FLAVVIALIGAALLTTPRPDDIRGCLTAKMHNIRLCPTEASYVKLKNISPHIRNAVLVSEDGGFYDHKGIDFYELRMSFEENLKEGRFARGGSTLTQQLAKNVYLSGEKSLIRKAREALIALQIEKILSKDEILERYLNVVEFGPKIYGVKQASSFYFGRAPSEVTVLEGAWLAFLLPNPTQYSASFRKRELTRFARTQLQTIVRRMARFQRITRDEEALALAQLENMFKPVEELIDPALEAELNQNTEGGEIEATESPSALPTEEPSSPDETSPATEEL